ncbi:MAG: MFS transporter [Brooklawnia sp.]|jgi:MFS family permease
MAISKAPATGWRPWVVWLAGTLAFITAMFSRTSFGVAGAYAAERFGSPITLMSIFVIVQMIVYASMQIPAGMLLDRLGSRRTIAIGTFIMATGQLGLAFASSFPLGLAARVLIGGGDAMIWISAIRLIPAWFAPKHVPLLTQVSSVSGQLGQWASAVPLVRMLSGAGWTPSFLVVAAACYGGLVINWLFVRDAPPGVRTTTAPGRAGALGLREVLRLPGAQLGFFIHMSTAYFQLIFSFMWGFPYLTQGQGLSEAQAGSMMSIFVAASMVIGPIMGILTQRLSAYRTYLALSVSVLTMAMWAIVLVWPGSAPSWLLVALMIVLAMCSPASNIAFDINRTFMPPERMGTGSGLVIVGGFLAAIVQIGVIGLLLGLVGGANPGPFAFRIAMGSQVVPWALAVVLTLRSRQRLLAAGADPH